MVNKKEESELENEIEHSEKSDDAIDMVFNKKRADDRKDWLKVYDRDAYLDTSKTCVSYEEFINREQTKRASSRPSVEVRHAFLVQLSADALLVMLRRTG